MLVDLHISQNAFSGRGLRTILSTVQNLNMKYPVPEGDLPRAFFLFATKNRPKSAKALKFDVHLNTKLEFKFERNKIVSSIF